MGGTERLTRRERATLDAVARRLTNGEIAAEFHVSVRTVESHIAALRRKLDADSRLALIAAAQRLRSASVNVPATSFVGRTADLGATRAALERDRWVTIVGPAGAGKTRLALEVAASTPRTPVVVELEHTSPGGVVPAIAKTMGLSGDSTADLLTQCAVAMGPERHLLVLDNCDRVLDDVAEAAGRLRAAARSLAVLATSRSPVGATAESIHALQPLSLDDGSAIEMFVGRARAAGAHVTSDDEGRAAVRRVCHRLDGLPLAIELAAARLRHLSLAELETRLDHGFTTLDRARPSGRHRTLETAFEWSWDLLDDEERGVLSRLAALPRTFDLALAEVVTWPGAGGVALRLLDRSLLAPVDGQADSVRFRLLDALREFVLAHTLPEVVEDVRRRHAEHHADVARGLASVARTDDSRATAQRAAANCVDVNAAARWALEHDPDLALSIGSSLSIGAEQFNPDVDSLSTIALVARDPRVRALATPDVLLRFGMALCYWDLDLVADLADLAVPRVTGEASRVAALQLAGLADAYRDRPTEALGHLRDAEHLADRLDDPWVLGSIRQSIGIALRNHDPERAIAALALAMADYARAGDTMHVNHARYMMAATAAGAGLRTSEAVAWADQCAAYARERGNHHELAHAMLTRASLPGAPDPDPDLEDATEQFRTSGDLRCLTRALLLLAARRPPTEQVPVLREAYDVAVRAHDLAHQTDAVAALVAALWRTGARRPAVVELGILTQLIGEGPARVRCAPSMLRELGNWDTTITEGRARAADLPPVS